MTVIYLIIHRWKKSSHSTYTDAHRKADIEDNLFNKNCILCCWVHLCWDQLEKAWWQKNCVLNKKCAWDNADFWWFIWIKIHIDFHSIKFYSSFCNKTTIIGKYQLSFQSRYTIKTVFNVLFSLLSRYSTENCIFWYLCFLWSESWNQIVQLWYKIQQY